MIKLLLYHLQQLQKRLFFLLFFFFLKITYFSSILSQLAIHEDKLPINFPQIYLFCWTGKIVCQMSIDDSVILSSDHARVEEQLVLVPTGESRRGFQLAEVLNPLLLAQH